MSKNKNIRIINDKKVKNMDNNIIKLEASNKTNNNIQYIYHLSDIHIRNEIDRHKEYLSVFEELYKSLVQSLINPLTCLTVVTGDVLHNKTILKPECISLTKDFFIGLTNLTDVIVILGNHDCNTNNEKSLNALYPIIKNLNTKNKIYLLNFNKLYSYKNIIFGVTTLYSRTVTSCKNINNNCIKIALYHGSLYKDNKNRNDNWNNWNNKFTVQNFDEYDIVMLGDIHKHKYLNEKKTIAYASSLIQQDYGESPLDHGYLKWNIKDKTSEFVRIRNNYGFITLNINDKIDNPYLFPKYPYIRVLYSNTDKMESRLVDYENYLRKCLKHNFDIKELVFVQNSDNINKNIQTERIQIEHIDDLDTLNKIIKEHIHNNQNVQNLTNIQIKDILNKIKTMDLDFDNPLKCICKNIQLERLKFGNLFSYGDNNEINFNKLNKIVGIVTSNGNGKTALIDSILYGIFGKFSKSDNKYHAMNIESNTCISEITMKVNNNLYKIIRQCKKFNNNIEFYENDELITSDDKSMTTKDIFKRYVIMMIL